LRNPVCKRNSAVPVVRLRGALSGRNKLSRSTTESKRRSAKCVVLIFQQHGIQWARGSPDFQRSPFSTHFLLATPFSDYQISRSVSNFKASPSLLIFSCVYNLDESLPDFEHPIIPAPPLITEAMACHCQPKNGVKRDKRKSVASAFDTK